MVAQFLSGAYDFSGHLRTGEYLRLSAGYDQRKGASELKNLQAVRTLLEREAAKRDSLTELSEDRPDPLFVARRYRDEYVALVCALFGYGNAVQILRFLNSLDFSLLDAEEAQIGKALAGYYYRFQRAEDVTALFIALRRLRRSDSLQELFQKGYGRTGSVIEGISTLIEAIASVCSYESRGYRFLIGQPYRRGVTSCYKRWNMFLRWMVRKDRLDMGLWSDVSRADLLIPLDTHTFHVSRRLGLLERRSCDLKSVFLLTDQLRRFDPEDPVRYDFALYRIGQENILGALK